MNNIENQDSNDKKVKTVALISIIIIILVATLGITYALFELPGVSKTISGDVNCYTVNYTKGQDISGELNITASYEGSNSTDIVMYSDPSCATMLGRLYITTNANSTMDLTDNALKYTVVSGNTVLAEGSINGTENQVIYQDFILNKTSTTYKVYIWLDQALENTDSGSETYSGFIHADAIAKSNIE